MDESRAVELYRAARGLRRNLKPRLALAPFDSFPDRSEPVLMERPFTATARQHLRDTTNFVNEFTFNLNTLRAWQHLMTGLPEHEQLDVLLEFVNPLAYFCLGVPYALKGRLHFSIAAVSHLANEFAVPGWHHIVDLGHSRYETAREHAERWESWPHLRSALGRLNNKPFLESVNGFRNDFHHGSPPYIQFGVKPFTQVLANGVVAFGHELPIALADVVAALVLQQKAALAAHSAFVALLQEQLRVADG